MNIFIKSRGPSLATPPLEGALEGIKEISYFMQTHIISARTPENFAKLVFCGIFHLFSYIISIKN